MRIALGSDHAGFELKQFVKEVLAGRNEQVNDVGTHGTESVDYADYGFRVAQLVSTGEADKGILVCGTGEGMNIVANKVKGVRAALVFDLYTAAQSRRHLDANVLVLGGRITGKGLAEEIVKIWLDTPFEGGRHQKRIDKIAAWEESNMVKT